MRSFDAAACESVTSLEAKRSAALAAAAASAALPPTPAPVLKTDALIDNIIGASTTVERISPVIALKTSCFPYPVTYLRALTAQSGSGTEWRPSLMNDAFFWNIQALALNDPAAPLYQKAIDEGASLDYQNVANYYMCPDAGYYAFDIGRILGTRELAVNATSSAAEILLASSTTLQVADAARFAEASGTREAAERALEGSANFDEIIRALISENDFILLTQKNGGYMQFSYLFAARSYAPILFFFGNPTFVPSPESFIRNVDPSSRSSALLSWHDTLSRTMSASQITDAAQTTITVLNALSK